MVKVLASTVKGVVTVKFSRHLRIFNSEVGSHLDGLLESMRSIGPGVANGWVFFEISAILFDRRNLWYRKHLAHSLKPCLIYSLLGL